MSNSINSVNISLAFIRKAIEKRIPKKPIKNLDYYVCRGCFADVPVDGFNYCPICGQRIDWSE